MKMKLITSKENKEFKYLSKLYKYFGKKDKVIIEGLRLCSLWLDNYGLPEKIIINNDHIHNQQITNIINNKNIKNILLINNQLMNILINSKGTYNKDIIFIVNKPKPEFLGNRIDDNCVILENIQDPGNVGNIIRTCAAVGIKKIFLNDKCATPWSSKVLKSSQGAHFFIDIYENSDLNNIINILNIPLISTSLIKNSMNLYDTKLPKICAWLFGNEGNGISHEMNLKANLIISIKHNNIDSLNVTSAAAICLFEHRRQFYLYNK
ncbi:tRNA (guanosine(18)-2'-O)-methyltransferase [Candidatus Kinetoplastibacterium sorsogonicusi]|uniref:tRNA (Guanosine(18)-2'-O)-methyltransferase n=1 Tax=Candidatus Kinetoplastidibacterium kentomonadis TaxID=1576550 RepID=A0A3S7J9U6_9PROT|nr:RNA methyltransferase [Candidatus Kinetoplastibacterium sorsogonicusi]AWD32434.1 tRNA (guanosine(18)-2'-O)-methyltransferase [Candidatus Kinetoplastibacterium sorsogonicusi]